MERGRIAEKLIDMVDVFVGHIRGGLGIVAVISCAVFGSICEPPCATLSCIGAHHVPASQTGRLPDGPRLRAHGERLAARPSHPAERDAHHLRVDQRHLRPLLAPPLDGRTCFVTIALLSLINVWMLRNNKEVFVEVKRSGKERMDMFMKRGRLAIPALVMPVMVLAESTAAL